MVKKFGGLLTILRRQMDFQVGMAPKIGTTYRSLAACQSYLPFAEDHLCAKFPKAR